MRNFLEKKIGKLKGDPAYKLDDRYTMRQLFFIAWYRFRQIWRGMFLKLRLESSGYLFCGRNVMVFQAYQIKAGRQLILEDGVKLYGLSSRGITFGHNVTVGTDAILSCTGVVANLGVGIAIGDRSAIGAGSFLGGQGGIKIGNDVIIGPHVKIFSENHNYDKPEPVIRLQGESRKGVVIGNNCWIGAGVVILDGVTIGDGCVIAAGSIVTRSLSDNQVAMGSPAVAVKPRIAGHKV